MSWLLLGIDILASFGGAVVGRKLASTALRHAPKLPKIVKEGVNIVAESLGATAYKQMAEGLTGRQKGDFGEELKANIMLGAMATAGFEGMRRGFKVASKVFKKSKTGEGKTLGEKIVNRFFFNDLPKSVRDKLGAWINPAFIVAQTSDTYSMRLRQFLKSPEFQDFYKQTVKKLSFIKPEFTQPLIQKDLMRPFTHRWTVALAFEKLLLEYPHLEFVSSFIKEIVNIPSYSEVRKAFINNRAKTIQNFFDELIQENDLRNLVRKKGEITNLPSKIEALLENLGEYLPAGTLKERLKYFIDHTQEIAKKIAEKVPDNVIVGYIPRHTIRIPVSEGIEEMDFPQVVRSAITPDIRFVLTQKGALKVRHFDTLEDKFIAFVSKATSQGLKPDEIEIGFIGGNTLSRAFVAGKTLPLLLANIDSLLKSLKDTKYVLFTDKKPQVLPENMHGNVFWTTDEGMVFVDKNLRDTIKNLMDRFSGFYASGSPIISFATWLKNLSLSFSLFHAVALTKSYFSLNKDSDINPLKNILTKLAYSVAQKKEYLDEYLDDVDFVQTTLLELAQKTGKPVPLTIGDSEITSRLAESLRETATWLIDKAVANTIKATITPFMARFLHTLSKVVEVPEYFMWGILYNALKLSTAKEVLTKWKVGAITDDEALKALRSINDVFGGAYEWVFVNPQSIGSQIVRLLLFAPDWYLSLWRNMTTWLRGESELVASFYPALFRLHSYIAYAMSKHAGIDWTDNVEKHFQWVADNFRYVFERSIENPIEIYTLAPRLIPVLLGASFEATTIKIPVVNRAGQIKILTFNPMKIEAEPFEMVGFMSAINLLKDFDKSLIEVLKALPDTAIGESLKYWSAKLSVPIRLITNIATKTAFQNEPEGLAILGETLLSLAPLSFVFYFQQTSRYRTTDELDPLMKFIFFMRNFSFGYKVKQTSEVLASLIHARVPLDASLIENLLDKQLQLKTGLYAYLREEGVPTQISFPKLIDSLAQNIATALKRKYHLDKITEEELYRLFETVRNMELGKYEALKPLIIKKLLAMYKRDWRSQALEDQPESY